MLDQNPARRILKMTAVCTAVIASALTFLAYASPFSDTMVSDHPRFIYSIVLLSALYSILGIAMAWGYESMLLYFTRRNKNPGVVLLVPLAFTIEIAIVFFVALRASGIWYYYNGFPHVA